MRSVYIPRGFLHGFQALTDVADTCYRIDAVHDPSEDVSVAFADPDLAIPWPLPPTLVSDRDRAAPSWRELRERLLGAADHPLAPSLTSLPPAAVRPDDLRVPVTSTNRWSPPGEHDATPRAAAELRVRPRPVRLQLLQLERLVAPHVRSSFLPSGHVDGHRAVLRVPGSPPFTSPSSGG